MIVKRKILLQFQHPVGRVVPAGFGDKIVIRDDDRNGLFEIAVMPAHADLFGYHVAQIIGDPGPHLRHIGDLYVYVQGFPPGGAEFYVQDFQFVVDEFPFKVGVQDGQLREFLLRQLGEGGF
jgi:hypothetical protein